MPRSNTQSGISLGKLFGIQIRVDWSLFVIFFLVVFSLGAGVFPSWHPNWSAALVWSLSIAAAVLFFLSVLLHEFSHALVAKAYGARVQSITLFLFGGMANIEKEPASPKEEAVIAGVGPLTSLVIGFACLLAAGAVASVDVNATSDPVGTLQRFSPAVTLLSWLGPVNIVLGLFNLLPGFPLDGGRLLRSLLWAATGDLRRATRWASIGGQTIGVSLIVTGIAMGFGISVPIFGSGLAGGIWLALIGMFLSTAAGASYRQLVVRELLSEVPIARLMRKNQPATVDSTTPLDRLAEFFISTGESAVPVSRGGVLAGVVHIDDVRRVPREAWARTVVADTMTPLSELATVSANEDAYEVLQKLSRGDADELVVLHGRDDLAGMVRRQDIARWLELQSKNRRTRPSVPRSAGSHS